MSLHHVDRRIAALAATQHGVFSREQAVAAGAAQVVRQRVVSGRWHRLGHHVFALAGAPVTWERTLHAAVLDAGPAAVATSSSAARLWGLPGFEPGPPEVLVPVGRNHRPASGRVRETRSLPQAHVTRASGIPVVTPARLIVELAVHERALRVERAVDSAIAASILTPARLAEVVAELACRGRRGSTVLREITAELLPGYVPPASELESRFRDVVRSAGLPEPVRQLDAGGSAWIGRVDVAYPAARLVVELDSRRWHDTRTARESDRQRDNALVAAGWRVIRITWRQLLDDPTGVVSLLRQLLASTSAAA